MQIALEEARAAGARGEVPVGCTIVHDGEVIAREGQKLAWVRANKLRDYPMPAADIPLIPHLIDLLM